MGIIPTPTNYGGDCLLCYPAGQTPNMLKLFLSGISIGALWLPGDPLPPNGYWDLTQKPGFPCLYELVGNPLFTMGYAPFKLAPMIAVVARGVASVFGSTSIFDCHKSFENNQVNPAVNWYYGGSAFLTTAASMQAMIELVTPITGPDPRMELFAGAGEEIFIRFADKQSATNVLLKLDVS